MLKCNCCRKIITQPEVDEANELFSSENTFCLDCATDMAADDAAETDPELREWINS